MDKRYIKDYSNQINLDIVYQQFCMQTSAATKLNYINYSIIVYTKSLEYETLFYPFVIKKNGYKNIYIKMI